MRYLMTQLKLGQLALLSLGLSLSPLLALSLRPIRTFPANPSH